MFSDGKERFASLFLMIFLKGSPDEPSFFDVVSRVVTLDKKSFYGNTGKAY